MFHVSGALTCRSRAAGEPPGGARENHLPYLEPAESVTHSKELAESPARSLTHRSCQFRNDAENSPIWPLEPLIGPSGTMLDVSFSGKLPVLAHNPVFSLTLWAADSIIRMVE